MMKNYILFGLILLFGSSLNSQVRFYASTDAKEVLKDSYIKYSIVLENAQGVNLKSPKFDGFSVVNGPSEASSVSIMNGKRTSSLSYVYTLIPLKLGRLTIDPATIMVNKKKLKTKAVTVNVLPAPKQGDQPGAFAEMTISDSTAVVGQRLVMTYTLFYDIRLDIRREELRYEDPFKGFTAERIKNYSRPSITRKVIKGKEYYVKILAETSMIPKDTGDIVINGAKFNLQVPSNNNAYGRMRSMKVVVANSNDLKVNVKPLPLSKPSNNSGAIGSYTISSTVNKRNITEDDAINLTLKISGTGISKDVIAPEYESTDKLDIYDPSLISENAYMRNGSLYHEIVYEYLMVPKTTGRAVFAPTFTFYDTDSMEYRTITATEHTFSVRKSNDVSKVDDIEAIQQEANELLPIQTGFKLDKKSPSFYKSTGYWIVLVLLSLMLLLMGAYKWILVQKENEDPEVKKAKEAQKVALDKLKLAKTYLDKKEIKPFYKEISNAMLGYVSDKLKLDTADITKTNVATKLQEISVSQQDTDRFIKLLNNSEMALYAGSQDAESMQLSYNDAITLISDIEAQLV